MDTDDVVLLFEPTDYAEAKEFVAMHLGERNFETLGHGAEMRDGAEAAGVLLKLGTISIPIIAALIALWLGKGKKVVVRKGKEQLELTNVTEAASKDLVREFLDSRPKKE